MRKCWATFLRPTSRPTRRLIRSCPASRLLSPFTASSIVSKAASVARSRASHLGAARPTAEQMMEKLRLLINATKTCCLPAGGTDGVSRVFVQVEAANQPLLMRSRSVLAASWETERHGYIQSSFRRPLVACFDQMLV